MAIVISVILLFVGIGFLILIHVYIVGKAFRRGLNLTDGYAVESSSFGSRSMSRDDVGKLPCFDFEVKEKGSSPVDCAVCLENFKAGDKCRLLPLCRHIFHAECVDLWLIQSPFCPICRTSADLLRTAGAILVEERIRYPESGAGSETRHPGEAAAAIDQSREGDGSASDNLTDAGFDLGLGERQTTRESTQWRASVHGECQLITANSHSSEIGTEQRHSDATECRCFREISAAEAGAVQTRERNVKRDSETEAGSLEPILANA